MPRTAESDCSELDSTDDSVFNEEKGERGEQELNHSDGQAAKFYRDLKQRGICVRISMEATGYSCWFERLLLN